MESNRIKHWRKRRGLSGAEVARRIGHSQPNFYRLESGQQQLTVELMRKLAIALDISPIDLLPVAIAAGIDNELERAPISSHHGTNAVLASRGLQAFVVRSSKVTRAGIKPGDTIIADTSEAAVAAAKTGDLVILNVTGDNLVLRQFVAPSLGTTNWEGANTVLDIADPELSAVIVGIVAI
jgi:transcriptional regulator with XRE-family HTH domain